MKHVIPLFVAAFTITGSAFGQVTQTATTAEIIVTGSRIPQPNLSSTSPITFKTDEDLKLQGSTQVSDLINNLPQQFQNAQIDLGNTQNPLLAAAGISTADLRGLGPQRTLVLINGRRLGLGDANTLNTNPAPDLNQIPAAMVERVDVVTGGASAVYGSDAIAGVVNFILKRNFEGVQVDAQYGFAQHTNENTLARSVLSAAGLPLPESDVVDGRNKEFSLIMGTNMDGGRGNATIFFNYRDNGAVTQGTRDFSGCKLGTNNGPNGGPLTPKCNNSPNSNEFIPIDQTILPTGASGDYTVVNNQFLDRPQAGSVPPATFNSSPYQVLQSPDTRYSFGFLAHEDFNERIGAYAEFNFMNDRSLINIAPSGLFEGGNAFDPTGNGGYFVNCDNPFLSAQQATAIGCGSLPAGSSVNLFIGRRNIEGLGRQSQYEHENYRGVFGLTGDIGHGWVYDTYVQYYYTSLFQSNNNYLSNSAISKALQVVNGPNGPACKSALDGSDTACVPYNIFNQGGLQTNVTQGVTQAAVDYINSIGTSYGTVEMKTIAGNIRNDLGKYGIQVPWASEGVSVSVGFEYRNEALRFRPDKASTSNDLSGFGGAGVSIDRAQSVVEGYAEIRVPVLSDKPFARDLSFGAAGRISDYTTSGTAVTDKIDFRWSPIEDFTLRGGYDRAIRAPNLIELFIPQTVTNTSVVGTDPCAGATPTASLAECQRTGVTPAQYGTITQCPANQCSVLNGGNPNLKPEIADSLSIGFTLTPRFLEDFTASVDYFHIHIAQEVNTQPVSVTLADCLSTGNAANCALVKRTASGTLFGTTIGGGGYIQGTNLNVAGATGSGLDFQASYRYTLPSSWGSLNAQFDGTYLEKSTLTLPGQPTYDCAELYGSVCQTLNPQWRHTLRLSWNTPWNVTTSLFWRHIGGMQLDTNSDPNGGNSALSNGVTDVFNASLRPMDYLDIAGTWNAGYGITVRGGVNNVFDSDPPLVSASISQTGSPNTYPTYDLLGRVFFLSVTAKF